MSNAEIMWTIIGGALTMTLIRIGPVLFLANRNFPIILRDWLAFIPAGILSAIVITEAFQYHELTRGGISVAFLSIVGTFIIGLITRSFLTCVIASVVLFMLFQHL